MAKHKPTELAATEALGPRPPSHAEVRKFRLHVIDGPDAGRSIGSTGARTVIGTHPKADFALRDQTLSRFHCELTLDDAGLVLRDLDSRNGTRVNEVPVLAAPLEDGAILTLGRTRVRLELRDDVALLPLSRRTSFGRLVGRSALMRRMFVLLDAAAASDSTVLLHGETGTGKDLAAEAIHRESARRSAPFVVVDCASIPATLLEAALFGHERGAFTGADQRRAGAFESARGGTVFLDEIGELNLDLQPALLRVLERKEVQRIGSSRRSPVDVRIIAATNRNLRREVNARRFRPDLYFRLAVLEVELPPLRDRLGDIPELVNGMLGEIAGRASRTSPLLTSPGFLGELMRHEWPGNVRELRNHLERCLATEGRVPVAPTGPGRADATVVADASVPLKQAREGWTRELERRYLTDLLARHDHNVAAAARTAGVGRTYLHRLLARRGLR